MVIVGVDFTVIKYKGLYHCPAALEFPTLCKKWSLGLCRNTFIAGSTTICWNVPSRKPHSLRMCKRRIYPCWQNASVNIKQIFANNHSDLTRTKPLNVWQTVQKTVQWSGTQVPLRHHLDMIESRVAQQNIKIGGKVAWPRLWKKGNLILRIRLVS